MEKDISFIISDFRTLSSKVYQMVCTDFGKSVKKLDRRTDENVFQQLLSRHINNLKQRLDQEAEKVVEEHSRHNAIRALQRELSGRVSYLVSAFLLKAKSM